MCMVIRHENMVFWGRQENMRTWGLFARGKTGEHENMGIACEG